MPISRIAIPVAALGIAVIVAGCGQDRLGGDVSNEGVGSGNSAQSADPCKEEEGKAAPLASDVEPTAVVRCFGGRERVPGDGEWSVTVRQRAIGPAADDLVTALRLPSEERTNGLCTMELRFPTVVYLETNGKVIAAGAPTDECGKTRMEVFNAFQELQWTDISRTRGEQVRSEAAVLAGCDGWKDMLAISSEDVGVGGPADVLGAAERLHVCLYRSIYPAGWKPADRTVVDGEPVGGGWLPPGAANDRLRRLLGEAGPATACTSRHSRFAVIAARGFDAAYVELDGCRRILAPDNTLRQGSEEIAELLSGVS